MNNTFAPGSSANPTSEVELTLSCRNLLDTDVFSKSDPMCVVSYKTPDTVKWREIFRTETIDNNLNPNFAKKVVLTYYFEVLQEIKFDIYDVDNDSPNLDGHDFLGSCTTTLGKIVSSGTLTIPLITTNNPNNKGQMIIRAEELAASRDELTLQFRGWNIDSSSGIFSWMLSLCHSKSLFLEFAKTSEDGSYIVVHRSEVVKNTVNPRWKRFSVPVRSFCGNDHHRDMRVQCFDYAFNGNHTLMGEFHVTLNQLSRGPIPENEFVCCKSSSKGERRSMNQQNNGKITLEYYEIRKVHTFLDYIGQGMQLNCTFAIDFTSSNGDPNHVSSLHYINPYQPQPNEYEQALRAVGDIIQDYDHDKMFPVLGFGARLPPDGRISHEFFVNLHPTVPFVKGIDGVLEAYKVCIRSVQLYGPTNFSPVINHVAKFAQTYLDGSQYFILLIITDGIITDMEQTKRAIVDSSTLPMSIIIVGVGNADFTSMDELDGDTVPLSYNGVVATRDIVQFVPFREFKDAADSTKARLLLAKEVLAEIPDQVVEYMKLKRIEPGAFKK